MIGIFWFLSVLISIPARFHTTRSYNYGGYSSNLDLNEPPSCRINQEHGYTVFSNIGAFYMPMIFIIGIYARIYQVARARIRRSAFKQSGTTNLCMSQWKQPKSKQSQQPQHQHSFRHHLNTLMKQQSYQIPIQQTQLNRERLEAKRERKAILTLAIITGCFLLCWLPFFIVALISPFINHLKITKFGQSMILWLGYSNSLLNPIIYTIFSPDFRNAFRKILFGRYNLRSLSR
uniref:G_PROTEIN_RECEP_F1_2 domain-containing protein n=1 Tax=Schistosoma curassoni TaxID=6186 RepID=A0A183JZ45_9TREM